MAPLNEKAMEWMPGSGLLGHTNVHTTEIYADVIMDKRTEAVNLTNGLFG